MHYLWVISSVPVSHILSTREDMHYLWVISSGPMRVCITRESYHWYPWVISSVPVSYTSVPMSHIISTHELYLSTHESYHQYPWGYAVPMSHIISTRESYPQYPWGYALPVKEVWFILHSYTFTHGYCISSRILRIWLTGSAYPHKYWGYDSQVLMIWLTGNAYPHGYWWYDSWVMHILTGTAYSLCMVQLNFLIATMVITMKQSKYFFSKSLCHKCGGVGQKVTGASCDRENIWIKWKRSALLLIM